MKIRQLVRGIEQIQVRGNRELNIRGLCSDSRKVAPGDLFIARRGEKHDASEYIEQVIQAGAVALVTDVYDPFIKLTQIISPNPGKIEAALAANFYEHPSQELFVVGITGSKGKTTTSYLVHHLLSPNCGLISTVETMFGEMKMASAFTTHEPIYNQKILREMRTRECTSAVIEVSSHGLALGRVEKIEFDIAVFTNLYPDHLDFHGTIEEYAKAKKMLFDLVKEKAIFNADDEWTSYMRKDSKARPFTYGIQNPADLMAKDISYSIDGTQFSIGKDVLIKTPLIGLHNVYNLLAAASVGVYLGMSLEKIASRLSSFQSVPARLERVPNTKGLQVFVDFAHTGEALQNVLQSLREIAPRRLLVLFGCGGNRDRARRKNMAIAAERFADLCIVTSDNPRDEPPDAIIREILSGFSRLDKTLVESDRKQAIRLALAKALPGDIVLIAGKGHEKMQIIGSQVIPFDDVAIAKEALF